MDAWPDRLTKVSFAPSFSGSESRFQRRTHCASVPAHNTRPGRRSVASVCQKTSSAMPSDTPTPVSVSVRLRANWAVTAMPSPLATLARGVPFLGRPNWARNVVGGENENPTYQAVLLGLLGNDRAIAVAGVLKNYGAEEGSVCSLNWGPRGVMRVLLRPRGGRERPIKPSKSHQEGKRNIGTDLTGSFCTKRNVRNRLGKEFCDAEEEV
jgi:hypothetical protein